MNLVGRLLLVVFLLAQGWIGFTGGAMVCVSMEPCAAHVVGNSGERLADPSDIRRGEPAHPSPCGDHSHGAVPAGSHEHPDCPCHVHVDGIDVPLAPSPGNSGVRMVAETQPASLVQPWIETRAVAADSSASRVVRETLTPPPPLLPPARLRPSRLVV